MTGVQLERFQEVEEPGVQFQEPPVQGGVLLRGCPGSFQLPDETYSGTCFDGYPYQVTNTITVLDMRAVLTLKAVVR